MSKAIGIDLGTAYSCVATVVDNEPIVIPDSKGRKSFPSIYTIDEDQNILIGHEVVEHSNYKTPKTIFAVKRLIGMKYESEEVQIAKSIVPYPIVAAKNGDAWVEVDGIKISPEEISSKILIYAKTIAEEYLQEEVSKAVITVPAHFNDLQRQATKDAGVIAGLEVLRIINEPTAAAIAYGVDNINYEEDTARIAVYDLGGGTFDISILEVNHGVFNVLSTHGDTYLGGEDFDRAIVEYIIEQYKTKANIDLSQNKNALQRLKYSAKDAKHVLSDETKVKIDLPYISDATDNLTIELSRKQLERICSPILRRTEKPCIQALKDANLIANEISEVVLVGGQTRMPAVKLFCKKVFKKDPMDDINPDEAVAVGAAIQAALLQGLIGGIELKDVIPLTLGVEIQGGKTAPVIMRNTPIPVSVSKTFTTSSPNQKQININILQGESEFAAENKKLGHFVLGNIPKAARGEPDIPIVIDVDGNGIINVKATNQKTGQEADIRIVPSSGLNDSQLDNLIRENSIRQQQKKRRSKLEQELSYKPSERRTSTDYLQDMDELDLALHDLKTSVYTVDFKLSSQGKNYERKDELLEKLTEARKILANSSSIEEISETTREIREFEGDLDYFINSPWLN